MNEDSLKASVQYGDFDGTAAADSSDFAGMEKFAKKHGIDTERYFRLGFKIYLGGQNFTSVSILTIDTEVVGAKSFDSIQEYINRNQKLPYSGFRTEATLEEAVKAFKRFEVVLHRKFAGVKKHELLDTEEPLL
jgi:hypothetical protein